MITTINPLLTEVSHQLNETLADTSNQRISFCNRAIRHVFNQYSWSFRRKSFDLTTSVGIQSYDLTDSSILTDDDYDPEFGIYEVWNGTSKLDPVLNQNISNYDSTDCFSLTPDNKSIIFTSTQSSPTTYTIWYYARHIDVSSDSSTINVSIPENFAIPITTYIRHLVHDSKRQRNDARNMILDFSEQISDLKMSQGKSKAKGLKQNVPTIMQYSRFKRTYAF